MSVAYEIVNVTKRYKPDQPPANDNISLTIHQGEVFGLLGPNGAGKTTLVRQLAGLSRPTSGSLRLFGHDLVRHPEIASLFIALQPQGFALPLHERPRALLEATAMLRGSSPADARRQASELLTLFGLDRYEKRSFYTLSGGLRRLLAIACALVGDRPILIFDEPTNDLDPEIRRTVWNRLREASAAGRTVVLVTHNVTEAEGVLDRVAIVHSGRILALGTPGQLKERVAQQLRLELLFRESHAAMAPQVLSGWDHVLQLGARRHAIIVPREDAEQSLVKLAPSLDALEDFRIVTPSLEDVYIELTGGEKLAS